MKTILLFVSFIILTALSVNHAQTTAYNFQGDDCNGNPVNLFSDLDAGKAVVLFYYMPNCGTCPPPAQNIQAMATKINNVCPDLVKGYVYPFQNSTTCAYSASWVTDNGLSMYTPMDSGAYQVAYYGGFGMPTVVLLGGANHDVLWSTQNFVDADTTTMRDLILGMACLGVDENTSNITSMKSFPNPASKDLTIEYFLKSEEDLTIQLVDMTGKVILKRPSIHGKSGLNTIFFDLNGIENGSYVMQIVTSDNLISKEIIVLK